MNSLYKKILSLVLSDAQILNTTFTNGLYWPKIHKKIDPVQMLFVYVYLWSGLIHMHLWCQLINSR